MSGDADLVGAAVGAVLRDRCGRDVVAAAERTGWAPELWAVLAEGGFPWVSVPEAAGGVGGSVAEACAALEQVGRFAAPVPFAETGLLAGWLLACAGLAVPSGPTTTGPGTVALRRAGAGWAATGSVARVPWTREAARIVLLADSPDGPAVVSVDPTLARIEPGTNLAGEPRDTVHLAAAPLTADDVAAAPPGVDTDALVLRGALSRVALIAGAAGRILDLTVAYTGAREQFGRPVARFQAVAGHLVRLAEQAAATRMAARTAAVNAAAGSGPTFLDVAAAKAVASEAAGIVAAAAHQATGAIGMTREYELGQLSRRLWSWREEYGGERRWSTELGRALTDAGDAALWPSLAAGDRPAGADI